MSEWVEGDGGGYTKVVEGYMVIFVICKCEMLYFNVAMFDIPGRDGGLRHWKRDRNESVYDDVFSRNSCANCAGLFRFECVFLLLRA